MANLIDIVTNGGPSGQGCRIYANFSDGTSLAMCRHDERVSPYMGDGTQGWWVEWQLRFVEDDEGQPYDYLEWSGGTYDTLPFVEANAEFMRRLALKQRTGSYE